MSMAQMAVAVAVAIVSGVLIASAVWLRGHRQRWSKAEALKPKTIELAERPPPVTYTALILQNDAPIAGAISGRAGLDQVVVVVRDHDRTVLALPLAGAGRLWREGLLLGWSP